MRLVQRLRHKIRTAGHVEIVAVVRNLPCEQLQFQIVGMSFEGRSEYVKIGLQTLRGGVPGHVAMPGGLPVGAARLKLPRIFQRGQDFGFLRECRFMNRGQIGVRQRSGTGCKQTEEGRKRAHGNPHSGESADQYSGGALRAQCYFRRARSRCNSR